MAGLGVDIEAAIDQASGLLVGRTDLLVYSGAGISVESGLPAFRGQGGLWGCYDERHLELDFFLAHPELAWPTIKEIFYADGPRPQPNAAHRILAAWEEHGWLELVLTQNIDGLHRRAGSSRLAEFHGSAAELDCLDCGRRVEASPELLHGLPPLCDCGGLLKPGFVFFGEAIPAAAYRQSMAAAASCGLCLIIGSTGTVYPAAGVPRRIKAGGGTVIEINPEPSEFTDDITDVFIPLSAVDAMQRLETRLRRD